MSGSIGLNRKHAFLMRCLCLVSPSVLLLSQRHKRVVLFFSLYLQLFSILRMVPSWSEVTGAALFNVEATLRNGKYRRATRRLNTFAVLVARIDDGGGHEHVQRVEGKHSRCFKVNGSVKQNGFNVRGGLTGDLT